MELPEGTFLKEDIEEINAVADSIDIMAGVFKEGGSTESLRMAASLFRTAANRLELIANRVERGEHG